MLAYVVSLKERFVIGCISNIQEPHVTLLNERGVLAHFEPRILSCEEGVRKPGRAIFERYCERARTQPEEVVFVDDQPENLTAPRAMGMHTVLFTGIGSLHEALSRIEHGRNPTGHP
ncbi:MAG: HAD-IA family hydrolase [Candidatus Woesearchaeota archaeon]